MQPLSRDMPIWQFFLFNFVVLMGHVLVLINAGAYLPMIPEVAGDFGVNPVYADWPQTDFFVGLALSGPLSIWLVSHRGEARIFLEIFAGFAAASAVCAWTDNFVVFLIARFFMGFLGGLSIPLSLNVMIRHYRPQRKSAGLTLWGVAALTPFTLGPVFGGWMTDAMGWRSLFCLDVPLALVVGIYGYLLLKGRDRRPSSNRLDYIGLLLLAGVLGFTQITLDTSEKYYWILSPTVIGLGSVAAALLIYFLVWEWKAVYPLVDLRILLRRNFAIGAVGIFGGMLFFQGLIAIYIVQAQVIFGYTAFLSGFLMLPIALLSKPVSSMMHRAVHRFDPRLLAFLNFFGFAVFCLAVSSYNRDASYEALLWPQVVLGIFLGGFFPSLTVIALSGLSGQAELRGVGVFNMIRVAAQGLGIPVIATLWSRRDYLHRHFLAENGVPQRQILHHVYGVFSSHRISPPAARDLIAARIAKHSALLAFNELFFVGAIVFLILAFIMLFARPVLFAEPDPLREQAIEDLAEP